MQLQTSWKTSQIFQEVSYHVLFWFYNRTESTIKKKNLTNIRYFISDIEYRILQLTFKIQRKCNSNLALYPNHTTHQKWRQNNFRYSKDSEKLFPMYNLLVSYSRMYTRKTGIKLKKKTSQASGNSNSNSKSRKEQSFW